MDACLGTVSTYWDFIITYNYEFIIHRLALPFLNRSKCMLRVYSTRLTELIAYVGIMFEHADSSILIIVFVFLFIYKNENSWEIMFLLMYYLID